MKKSREKFKGIARGYGAMLLIAILGLSALIFGGIFVNERKIEELQTSMDELEKAYQDQVQLKPFLAVVADRQQKLQADKLPVPPKRPLTFEEIADIRQTLQGIAASSGLQVLSIRPLLQTNLAGKKFIRLEIRFLGQFAHLHPFLHELTNWEYQSTLEAFTLQAADGGQEMQLVIKLAVI